ncbi:MAG: energy transducer TonB [Bacteroidales bacterium]|nr:energy transducer TonB [Bacteroidales bacterium]
MKKQILLLLFIGCFSFSFSQIDEDFEIVPTIRVSDQVSDSNAVYTVVEQLPDFPGGNEARMQFLNKHIKYPESAKEDGIQGTVYATFIVEKDGSLSDIKILRGLSSEINAEVIRVIELFPKWIPGKQNGKIVRVQYSIPFRFRLDD